jgi:hypothetical protein
MAMPAARGVILRSSRTASNLQGGGTVRLSYHCLAGLPSGIMGMPLPMPMSWSETTENG